MTTATDATVGGDRAAGPEGATVPPVRVTEPVTAVVFGACECCNAGSQPNTLVFRIQPDEGISLSFAAKRPGMRLALGPVEMAFGYAGSFGEPVPEAYERLLFDALRGDPTRFLRSDEVAVAWAFVDPVLAAWRDAPLPPFPNYTAGTWGPPEADRLAGGCRAGWRKP